MIKRLNSVETITLFVESLNDARHFYTQLLDFTVIYEDDVSVVIKLDNLMLNLLQASEAPELIAPLRPGSHELGPRFMITIVVADVDAAVADLTDRGIAFLNGPIDRPWGRRTAAFADPAGVVWEIAQVLPERQ